MSKGKDPMLVNRKIAVVGDRSVGKTGLIQSFCQGGEFREGYDPTIETTYSKTIRFRKVHFATDIVDTAGMDEHSRLSRNASLGVHGYVLVFRSSFEMIKVINQSLLGTLGEAPNIPRVLVGTMKDLAEQRQVNYQDAERLAESWGIPYVECSSKTGENTAEVFHTVLKEIEKEDGLLAEAGLDAGCVIL